MQIEYKKSAGSVQKLFLGVHDAICARFSRLEPSILMALAVICLASQSKHNVLGLLDALQEIQSAVGSESRL